MIEADWKRFRKMMPELRERYLCRINAELIELLADESKTPTERFWAVEEKTHQEAKILRRCFDGTSRSKLTLFMMNMYHCGIMQEKDFVDFSKEIQDLLNRIKNCDL